MPRLPGVDAAAHACIHAETSRISRAQHQHGLAGALADVRNAQHADPVHPQEAANIPTVVWLASSDEDDASVPSKRARTVQDGPGAPSDSPRGRGRPSVQGRRAAQAWHELDPRERSTRDMERFARDFLVTKRAMQYYVDVYGNYTELMSRREDSKPTGAGAPGFGKGVEAARAWHALSDEQRAETSMERWAHREFGITGRAVRRFVDPSGAYRDAMTPHLEQHPPLVREPASHAVVASTPIQEPDAARTPVSSPVTQPRPEADDSLEAWDPALCDAIVDAWRSGED